MKDAVIRASEVGNYLYCQRAWWYQRNGVESANVRELAHGSAAHEAHALRLRRVAILRGLAVLLLAAAVVLLFVR